MAKKIRIHTSQKQIVRYKRKRRIRARIEGDLERPRLSIFRSNRYMYVQLINDIKGHTIVSASTHGKDFPQKTLTIQAAQHLGQLIAKKAKEKQITKIVFDRSGYLYHGKVKALADAARQAGLEF